MIEILRLLIPYPFVYGGVLVDGHRLQQHNACKKCSDKPCGTQSLYIDSHMQCSKGFSCFTLPSGSDVLVINGVISARTRANFTGDRWKTYKKYRVEDNDIENIERALSSLQAFLDKQQELQVRDSVSFLHEVRTSVGIVLNWCQELIDRQEGESFEEKLVSADATTLNLLNSINLLSEQLNLIDIIANPAAITYGKQYDSQIHGFLKKMVKLFEPGAAKRNVNIVLKGKTYAEVRTYNSFQYLPLVLLDNAIKYCSPHSDITVSLIERKGRVTCTVSSVGPIVPMEDRERIFEKYHRCAYAALASSKGMGMGLYLARQIARAHGTDIIYRAMPNIGLIGTSEFSVSLDIVK